MRSSFLAEGCQDLVYDKHAYYVYVIIVDDVIVCNEDIFVLINYMNWFQILLGNRTTGGEETEN